MLTPAITDPVSALTHGLGALAFAAFSAPLLRRGRRGRDGAGASRGVCSRRARVASLAVFASTAALLLTASAAFHAVPKETLSRTVLQRADHAAIFLLIAGTFTPIHTILFTGPLRWAVLLFVWIGAIAGATLKTIYFTSMSEGVGVLLYLLFGWAGTLTMIAVWRLHGARYTWLIVAAGLAYTIGAIFELTNWPTIEPGLIGPHEAFHMAVLVGLGLFWMFIYEIAGGVPASRGAQRETDARGDPGDPRRRDRSLRRSA